MTTALLGYSGFVGSNLLRARSFDDLYRSTDIEDIAGRDYELVACAAAPAQKWLANREPEADLASIERLLGAVCRARIARLVLISTVDVYPDPVGVDEDSPIPEAGSTPYGRHRLLLERRLAERFDTTILRLPGLYGPGLKKNVIYDLIHANQVERIPANGVFQFYPVERTWADAERALAAGIRLANLATEPVAVRRIATEAFGLDAAGSEVETPPRYDFRTRHAEVFGGRGAYVLDADAVVAGIRAFAEGCGWRRP